jgi:phenylpyruvate tautomerase PptA (4-oxalocrotonate tautomerase family)
MPMLDAIIPEGALSDEAEKKLCSQLTDILLRTEGADPKDPTARSIAVLTLHRTAEIFVGGEVAKEPRYRIFGSVPEGQYTDERRQKMVEQITEAVLDAEDGAYERDPMRVWVFANEIPEGTWGALGQIFRLADIIEFVIGDKAENGRELAEQLAEQRLAARNNVGVPA